MNQNRYPRLETYYQQGKSQPLKLKPHICIFERVTDAPEIQIDILEPKNIVFHRCKFCGQLKTTTEPAVRRKGMSVYGDTTKRVSNQSNREIEEWKHLVWNGWERKE